MKYYNKRIFSLLIHLNNKCNMNCPYCYDSKFRDNSEINYETILQCIEYLKKYGKNQKIRVMILGGEPTLSLDKLKFLLNNLNDKWYIELMSNGYNWNDDFFKIIEPYKNRLTIITSYDGYYQNLNKVNSEIIVKNNINLAISKNFKIMPCFTTSNDNILYIIENTLKLIKDFPNTKQFFIKKNCNQNIWYSNNYNSNLKKILQKYSNLIAHLYISKGIYIQTLNRINMGTRFDLPNRNGNFSCNTCIKTSLAVDTLGNLYPCEVCCCNKIGSVGNVFTGFNKKLINKLTYSKFKGTKYYNYICVYANKVKNKNWFDCKNCINDAADKMLYDIRFKIQAHYDKLNRLKKFYLENKFK